MADPKRALEILEKYYATVTPEKFLEDVRRAVPTEESSYDGLMDFKERDERSKSTENPHLSKDSQEGVLEDYITQKIAERENVDPKIVDLDFIRKQREKKSQPSDHDIVCSAYGGYILEVTKVCSPDELEKLAKHTIERLEQFLMTHSES